MNKHLHTHPPRRSPRSQDHRLFGIRRRIHVPTPSSSGVDGTDPAERIERWVAGRWEFLLGLAAGGTISAGAALGLNRIASGAGYQPLVSLAGGETAGASGYRYYLPAADPARG